MCQLSHNCHVFCVPFTEKLDHLLDRLDNRRMMHDSRSDALKWVRMDQQISPSSSTDNHLAFHLPYMLRVYLSLSLLANNE
jgi:hypothetical protein